MGAKIDIVLIDGGDDVGSTGGSGASGPGPMPSRTIPPSGEPFRPEPRKTKDRDDGTAAGAALDLASTISSALGGVALFDTAMRLKKAFDDIYVSVSKLDEKLNRTGESGPGGRTEVETAREKATSRQTSRSKSPEDDFIEGEFTVSRPQAELPGMDPGTRELTTQLRGPRPTQATDLTSRTQIATKTFEGTVEGGEAAGALATRAAPEAAKGLQAVAAAAGPLAIAIGATVVAVAAGAMAIKAAFDAINNEVKRLEGISPDVGVAVSMTEIRREFADMRRADQIGPQLARFETIRSKAEDKLYDLQTELLKIVLTFYQAVEPVLPDVINGIELLTASVASQGKTLEILVDFMTGNFGELTKDIKEQGEINKRWGKKLEELLLRQRDAEEDDQEDPFMRMLLAQFNGGQI